MITYQYQGKKGKRFKLEESRDTIVVRTQRRLPLSRLPLSLRSRAIVGKLQSVVRFPSAGVEVLRADTRVSRDDARKAR